MGGGYTPLTSLPVSEGQYETLFGGTPLDAVARGKTTEAQDCEVGRRRVRVEVMRRGEEMALRISAAAQPGAKTQLIETVARPDRTPVETVARPERTQPLEVQRSDMRPERTQPLDVQRSDMRPRSPSTPPDAHPRETV